MWTSLDYDRRHRLTCIALYVSIYQHRDFQRPDVLQTATPDSMTDKNLTHFKGLTFDIIGTLVDYEAGVLAWCRHRLPQTLTDDQILESFARVEKSIHVIDTSLASARRRPDPQYQQNKKSERNDPLQVHSPELNFMQMFLQIWPGMAKEFGSEAKPDEGKDFAASALDWDPFADSKEALAYI